MLARGTREAGAQAGRVPVGFRQRDASHRTVGVGPYHIDHNRKVDTHVRRILSL